jgi:hypothetical protein
MTRNELPVPLMREGLRITPQGDESHFTGAKGTLTRDFAP